MWQLEQLPVTVLWSNVAGVQAVVPWQALHSSVVGIWVGFLPPASEPLWQPAQLPSTSLWSTRSAGVQAAVAWQASQVLDELMCSGFLPVARVPLWQE